MKITSDIKLLLESNVQKHPTAEQWLLCVQVGLLRPRIRSATNHQQLHQTILAAITIVEDILLHCWPSINIGFHQGNTVLGCSLTSGGTACCFQSMICSSAASTTVHVDNLTGYFRVKFDCPMRCNAGLSSSSTLKDKRWSAQLKSERFLHIYGSEGCERWCSSYRSHLSATVFLLVLGLMATVLSEVCK